MENSHIDRQLARKIQIVLFFFVGSTNLGLWYVGPTKVVGAVLGIILLAGTVFLAWRMYGKRA